MVGLVNYNPDVLTCLANLSSDEVFTPPSLANDMLDLLPAELWSDPTATFLDPGCKSGVFLREIARRLETGLEQQFPDLQQRLDHIFTKQIYGLAITELTALLARRSVYCSKLANGRYSVCEAFADADGNIRFRPAPHTWRDGRCTYCGASEREYSEKRSEDLEAHAYEFIHLADPKELFNMHFDVIIGNPPYQLSDGGFGKSASPIYNKFVEQAKKLEPRFLSMIIPSRWFGGGKGLNNFRKDMLSDHRLRVLVDFEDARDPFPNVDLAGGICYFLWEKDYKGPCRVVNAHNGVEAEAVRDLDEFPTFIRDSRAVSIVRKALAHTEPRMSSQVTSRKPFGLATTVRPMRSGDITLRWQKGEGPYLRSEIDTGTEMIDKWKVITSYVGYDHAGSPDKEGKRRVFSKIDILPPGTICTETYLVVGSFNSEEEAQNLVAYMKTRFFRFLVSQFMYSHHITREAYAFVPLLDMHQTWSDAQLVDRYELSKEDMDFIASKIKEMG